MKTANMFKAMLLTAGCVMFLSSPGISKGSLNMNPFDMVYHPDSIIVYNFEGNSKEIFTYDINQNLITWLKLLELNRNWENSELHSYVYNENGNLLTDAFRQWNGAEWANVSLNIYTYDDNGNMLTNLGQTWDSAAWVNSSLFTYTYDDNGNKLTFVNQYWDTDNWYNAEMDTYTYDENGNELTDTWHMWEDPDWVAYMLTAYTYDENGNRLTLLEQYWDGDWINSTFVTYTYDENNNELYHLAQSWTGEDWENMSQATLTYDMNGNCLSRIDQWWWWSGEWQNTDKCEYEYQPGLIIGHGFTWNETDWEIGDTYSMRVTIFNNGQQNVLWDYGYCHLVEVYYSGYGVGIPEKDEKPSLSLSVYPNPSQESFTITTETIQPETVCISLFDLSGKEILTLHEGIMQSGPQSITINTNDFRAGLYILEMRTATNSSRQKISIIR